MRLKGRRLGRLAGGALAALAAGCQPLPQPFRDDKPSAELISVPDSAVIAVGSFEGEPRATADKLGTAVAQALLTREIPATARTTGIGSFRLDGRIEASPPRQGRQTVSVFWRLRNPAGSIVSERTDRLEAAVEEWDKGNDDRVAQLAALGADSLAASITTQGPRPAAQAAASSRLRVAVRGIGGAPGDGNASLGTAVGAILRRQDIEVVQGENDKADLDVGAAITVDPVKAGNQHVKIVWRVAKPDGSEIGKVAMENDVPRGRLDGPWGDIAYTVAMAAAPGILELVSRGAPPLKVTGAPPPAAVPEAALPSPAPAAPVAAQPLPQAGTATAGASAVGMPAAGMSAAGMPTGPAAAAVVPKPAPSPPPIVDPIPMMNPPAVIGPPPSIPFRGVPLPQ